MMPNDPMAMLRSRSYLRLLVLAAILGVPVPAVAYRFLALVSYLQKELFTRLPRGLGFQAEPVWRPLPMLAIGYLPGRDGLSRADRFKMHGLSAPAQLPGVISARSYGSACDVRAPGATAR